MAEKWLILSKTAEKPYPLGPPLGLGHQRLSICNLFVKNPEELVQKCPCIPRSSWNLKMLVFEDRRKPEYLEKNLWEQRRKPTTNLIHI